MQIRGCQHRTQMSQGHCCDEETLAYCLKQGNCIGVIRFPLGKMIKQLRRGPRTVCGFFSLKMEKQGFEKKINYFETLAVILSEKYH